MKTLKKVLAMCLALVLVLSFAGCHQKNEVAVKAGDDTFTSAFYMCALINADTAARTKIDEAKAAEKENATSSTTSATTDYFAETIDGKSYEDYVKESALNTIKRFVYVKRMCDENNLTISEQEKNNSLTMTEYYWNYYGYASLFEANGVSLATYKEYTLYSLYEDKYFNFIYGEGGDKAVSDTDIKNFLYSNYVIADVLSASVASKKDSEKALVQTDFEKYKGRLEKGETFEKIYKEYNKVKEDTTSSTTSSTASLATSSTTSGSEENKALAPKDSYAQVIGSKETSYSSKQYETIKAMKTGEVKFVKDDESGYYYLFVKGDITADPYYLEGLKKNVLNDMKFDEFEAAIKAEAAKVELKTVAFAINQFKVKKIKYPY
ncbi:MAG: hypothetical protein IJX79_02555 [Clostridia bacterium]|nr:hypothetical protein [Clostridia bacterium]